MGDNPLAPFWGYSVILSVCCFRPHFLYGYTVKTIFLPLTLSLDHIFYYIRFPDNKGVVSTERGETTERSV